MFGKNGEKWFVIIFCGCFLLTGIIFTGTAIAFLFSGDAGTRIMAAGFGFIGILFTVIASFFLLGRRRQKRIMNKVRTEGRRLYAVVTDVAVNTSYTMNGRHPFVVNCQYTDGTAIHTFRSGNIWFDPSPVIIPGMEISVYVNPDNYNQYWVDTDTPLAAITVINH